MSRRHTHFRLCESVHLPGQDTNSSRQRGQHLACRASRPGARCSDNIVITLKKGVAGNVQGKHCLAHIGMLA